MSRSEDRLRELAEELLALVPVMLENIRTGETQGSRRQRRELARLYGIEFLEEESMEKVDAVLRKHDSLALRVGEDLLKCFDKAHKSLTPSEERARRSLVEYLERLRAAVGEVDSSPGE